MGGKKLTFAEWTEYYRKEMQKIEKSKRRLEKIFITIVAVFISVEIACCYPF